MNYKDILANKSFPVNLKGSPNGRGKTIVVKLWDAQKVLSEQIANQLESQVKPDNGGQFEEAYKHAMKVLEDYILVTRDRWTEAKSDESKEHYSMKEQFMRTAKRTIEENYKMYLAHPELFNK